MVHIRDLVNPIPTTMVFKYNIGDNVCYNERCFTVHKHRNCGGNPSYLIKACRGDKVTHDKVLESELSDCCSTNVIDEAWEEFVYTGDNIAASDFVFKMVAQTSCCKEITYGPNEDNTQYIVRYCCEKMNKMVEKVKAKTE